MTEHRAAVFVLALAVFVVGAGLLVATTAAAARRPQPQREEARTSQAIVEGVLVTLPLLATVVLLIYAWQTS